jgi:hypothetical protein
MSNNFGNLPAYITSELPTPILDVNASGLVDATGFASINITGPYAVILKSSSLPNTSQPGMFFYVVNSTNVSVCSITLDNGGNIVSPTTSGSVWTINYFPRLFGPAQRFKFDGTNLIWS